MNVYPPNGTSDECLFQLSCIYKPGEGLNMKAQELAMIAKLAFPKLVTGLTITKTDYHSSNDIAALPSDPLSSELIIVLFLYGLHFLWRMYKGRDPDGEVYSAWWHPVVSVLTFTGIWTMVSVLIKAVTQSRGMEGMVDVFESYLDMSAVPIIGIVKELGSLILFNLRITSEGIYGYEDVGWVGILLNLIIFALFTDYFKYDKKALDIPFPSSISWDDSTSETESESIKVAHAWNSAFHGNIRFVLTATICLLPFCLLPSKKVEQNLASIFVFLITAVSFVWGYTFSGILVALCHLWYFQDLATRSFVLLFCVFLTMVGGFSIEEP